MADDHSRRERRLKQRQEREETIRAQRAQQHRRERTKRVINWGIALVAAFAITYLIYVLLGDRGPGQYDDLARCISKTGATMYGTDWCPHCQAQKRAFGSSFKYINYINCDLNRPACDLAGVEGFPTWTFASGPALSGEQELAVLAERTGCVLP